MNDVQKGYYRDRQVLELVENCRSLTTDQISTWLFGYHRTAQRRLKRLYEAKRLKRCRLSQDTPYCYYVDRKPGQLEHLVAVNWVRLWFQTRLTSWETLFHWEYEPDYDILRADAFAGIKNSVTGESRFWFVEVDLSDNPFDKVDRYNRLYESKGYSGRWWVKQTSRFPGILVVTETREPRIRQAVDHDNANGLQFNVRLLKDLIQEAGSCKI